MCSVKTEKNILVDQGIKPGGWSPSSPHANPYGSGGNGGAGGGSWSFGLGSGGGGFSGGFGGSSRRRAKKRAKARAEQERARIREEQARAEYARQVGTLTQNHLAKRQEWDQAYAAKANSLTTQLDAELKAIRKAPSNHQTGSDWGLYLISKQKSEIATLISTKEGELQTRQTESLAFDGHHPFSRSPDDYRHTLIEQAANDINVLATVNERWERAYIAAHEIVILSESIGKLTEQSQALSERYAEREKVAQEQAKEAEQRRQYKERRLEQIRHRLRVEEDQRRELIKTANTVSIPASASSVAVLTRSGVTVLEGLAAALEGAVAETVAELGRVLALRVGQTVALTATSLLYSSELGNGELTAEQRQRLFQGISVGSDTMGMPDPTQLQTAANSGGWIDVQHRIRPVAVDSGTELHVVTTGSAVPAQVSVINAVYDPAADSYIAQTSTMPPRRIVVKAPTVIASQMVHTAQDPVLSLSTTAPQVLEVPHGADLRINDCVVCFPAASGLNPRYFSFMPQPIGQGIVTGNGHTVTADWWATAQQDQGAVIPVDMSDYLRSREFKSFDTFDKNIWRMMAESSLTNTFDEINRKRIAKGFPPYALKSFWADGRREYEIRIGTPTDLGVDDFNLDTLRIVPPNSTFGAIRKAPTYVPWPVASGSTSWAPLVPPGIEALGPTELPHAPEEPEVYPGPALNPVAAENEILPAADPTDVETEIPGFGDGDELPSPDLEFVGPPVEPLEVGPYNELSARSRKDGLDIDHIVSQQALKLHIIKNYALLSPKELLGHLKKAPCIAIPSSVHKKFSETYGGRNTKAKQIEDGMDLKKAVDSNIDALKSGLIEAGLSSDAIELARQKLHTLNEEQGWY